jgi:hypothetical protein
MPLRGTTTDERGQDRRDHCRPSTPFSEEFHVRPAVVRRLPPDASESAGSHSGVRLLRPEARGHATGSGQATTAQGWSLSVGAPNPHFPGVCRRCGHDNTRAIRAAGESFGNSDHQAPRRPNPRAQNEPNRPGVGPRGSRPPVRRGRPGTVTKRTQSPASFTIPSPQHVARTVRRRGTWGRSPGRPMRLRSQIRDPSNAERSQAPRGPSESWAGARTTVAWSETGRDPPAMVRPETSVGRSAPGRGLFRSPIPAENYPFPTALSPAIDARAPPPPRPRG